MVDHSNKEESHLFDSSHEPELEASEEQGWLVSYADMMTLLFGLFVLLFSISSIDQSKYEELKKAVTERFSGDEEYHSPIEDLQKDLMERLAKSQLNLNEVEVLQNAEGLQISLRGSAFFESGRTELLPKGLIFIDQVAAAVRQSPLDYEVRVEGHTDDAPTVGTIYSSNWDLSAARAVVVVRRLEKLGIQSSRLAALGLGDSRPLVPNRTADGFPIVENMAKNRRVMIEVGIRQFSNSSSKKNENHHSGTGS